MAANRSAGCAAEAYRTETGVRLEVVECENDLEKKTQTLKS